MSGALDKRLLMGLAYLALQGHETIGDVEDPGEWSLDQLMTDLARRGLATCAMEGDVLTYRPTRLAYRTLRTYPSADEMLDIVEGWSPRPQPSAEGLQ